MDQTGKIVKLLRSLLTYYMYRERDLQQTNASPKRIWFSEKYQLHNMILHSYLDEAEACSVFEIVFALTHRDYKMFSPFLNVIIQRLRHVVQSSMSEQQFDLAYHYLYSFEHPDYWVNGLLDFFQSFPQGLWCSEMSRFPLDEMVNMQILDLSALQIPVGFGI